MRNPIDERTRDQVPITMPRPPRPPSHTWVELLSADSQLSYEDPRNYTQWVRGISKSSILPGSFRWAALGLFATSLPALFLAAAQLARHPALFSLPWVLCGFLAGLWAFRETPGKLRITTSGCVTVAAFSTVGFAGGIMCATAAAVSSWAISARGGRWFKGHLLLANWANLVLSAAAGAMIFDLALGVQGEVDLLTKLASNRFLLAFPMGIVTYVLVNTSLAALAMSTRADRAFVPIWRDLYSGVGLLFSVGLLQAFAFIIAFASWGAFGPDYFGPAIAFLVVVILLGAGKLWVLQYEAREHITCLASLLRVATRPDDSKYPFVTYLMDNLLARGTKRFLSGIPPEELTFEAEEAVFTAEVAWKLGASEHSIRSYLVQNEVPDGSGPFGLKELGLPVWSPSFPGHRDRPSRPTGAREDPEWLHPVIRCLLDAARPASEDLTDENLKWNRLALSGARAIHSLLERYDYGRRFGLVEDQQWWTMCELVGFSGSTDPEALPRERGPEPDLQI